MTDLAFPPTVLGSPAMSALVLVGGFPPASHAVFAVAGWVVAGLGVAAALVLRRLQDHRLALVAEAAHEVRGPLCAARLGLHALESAGDPVARRAAAVELELRRAGLALEDLAAAPRGRRTSDRRELVDAGALMVGAALAWSAVARAHGSRLRVEAPREPALVRGDRLRLAQALGNLVANAAEHGGGEVQVRGTVARGAIRIEVSDDGPGLRASVSELIGPRHARSPRGHGLAVAARIAARHGGRLASAPSPRGARLVLELPLARPEPPPTLRLARLVGALRQPLEAGNGAGVRRGDGSAQSLRDGVAARVGDGSPPRLGDGSASALGEAASREPRATGPRPASAR